MKPARKKRTSETHEAHVRELELNPDRTRKIRTVLLGASNFQRLATNYSYGQFAQDYGVYNAGVGGDGIQHMLWRVQQGHLFRHVKPKVVVIMAGTNNIATHSDQDIVTGVSQLVQAVREATFNKARIVLMSILPMHQSGASAEHIVELNARIKGINALLATFVGTTVDPNMQFEDFMSQFCLDLVPQREYFSDDVHLNALGQRRFLHGLAGALDDAFRQ